MPAVRCRKTTTDTIHGASHAIRTLASPATALLVVAAAFPCRGRRCRPSTTPFSEPIRKGDLVVEANRFVRAPQTEESALDAITNLAYARIQYLTPIGDGSGRLVLNDLRGPLYITDENGMDPVTYLDIRTRDVGFDDSMFPNETGLVGVAFHPQFAAAGTPGYGKFYTAYSATSDSGRADYLDDDAESHESVIREWTADDPAANEFTGTSREVFRIGQFASNHNIGVLAFNPTADAGSPDYGILYASLGDAGAANDPRDFSQTLGEPHGAIIRIDPLGGDDSRGYGIPADNPFVGEAGVAPEIWAYGLRHAQQFSWDTDGRMFMGDIGQNFVEEVNLGVPGANYGWRLREGTFATGYAVGARRPGRVYPLPAEDDPSFVYPVAQYDHGEGQRRRRRVRLSRSGNSRPAGQVRLHRLPARPGAVHRCGRARARSARRDPRAAADRRRRGARSGRRGRVPQHLRPRRPGGRAPGHRLDRGALPADEGRRLGAEAGARASAIGRRDARPGSVSGGRSSSRECFDRVR